MQGIELIPHGELEGLPAVPVTVPPHADPAFLVQQFTRSWRPGVRVLHLSTPGWGTAALEECLGYFQSDARTHQVVVWCDRPVTDEKWSASPVWNVVDCSSLLGAPMTSDVLVEKMLRVPYIPRPTEIVVSDPDEANLLPGLLDEITTHLDPERASWILLTDPSPRMLKRATMAAAGAAGGWGVRTKGS